MEITDFSFDTLHERLHSAFVDFLGCCFDFSGEVSNSRGSLVILEQDALEFCPVPFNWPKLWDIWWIDVLRYNNNIIGFIPLIRISGIVDRRAIRPEKRRLLMPCIQRQK